MSFWGLEQNWVVVSNIFYFHPYLGKIPILTNIFQMGWNHQLENLGWWNLVYFSNKSITVYPCRFEVVRSNLSKSGSWQLCKRYVFFPYWLRRFFLLQEWLRTDDLQRLNLRNLPVNVVDCSNRCGSDTFWGTQPARKQEIWQRLWICFACFNLATPVPRSVQRAAFSFLGSFPNVKVNGATLMIPLFNLQPLSRPLLRVVPFASIVVYLNRHGNLNRCASCSNSVDWSPSIPGINKGAEATSTVM